MFTHNITYLFTYIHTCLEHSSLVHHFLETHLLPSSLKHTFSISFRLILVVTYNLYIGKKTLLCQVLVNLLNIYLTHIFFSFSFQVSRKSFRWKYAAENRSQCHRTLLPYYRQCLGYTPRTLLLSNWKCHGDQWVFRISHYKKLCIKNYFSPWATTFGPWAQFICSFLCDVVIFHLWAPMMIHENLHQIYCGLSVT